MSQKIWAIIGNDGSHKIIKTKKTFDKYISKDHLAHAEFEDEKEQTALEQAEQWIKQFGLEEKQGDTNQLETTSEPVPSDELVHKIKELEEKLALSEEMVNALTENNQKLLSRIQELEAQINPEPSHQAPKCVPEQTTLHKSENNSYDWRNFPGIDGFDYIIYTDGACAENGKRNGGFGGWGAIITNRAGQRKELSGWASGTTNNCMELAGPITALKLIADNKNDPTLKVALLTDSQYVIRGALEWAPNWVKNGWRNSKGDPVANRILWELFLDLLNKVDTKLYWVKGHNGDPNNERCDQLAVAECIKAAHANGRFDITQQDC